MLVSAISWIANSSSLRNRICSRYGVAVHIVVRIFRLCGGYPNAVSHDASILVFAPQKGLDRQSAHRLLPHEVQVDTNGRFSEHRARAC